MRDIEGGACLVVCHLSHSLRIEHANLRFLGDFRVAEHMRVQLRQQFSYELLCNNNESTQRSVICMNEQLRVAIHE